VKTTLKALIASSTVMTSLAFGGAVLAQETTACLITKTDTNPFFVKMREGAAAKAAELGINLQSYAGQVDGDHDSQVAAVETCIAAGAKGILIAASDTKAIVDPLARAREAGLLVIALDTPLDPADAADATFATDNLEAGRLIGAVGRGDAGGRGRQRADRVPEPHAVATDCGRPAQPGLHDGLRDRCEGRLAHR
jgi:fructose transport system substrate-binding protein